MYVSFHAYYVNLAANSLDEGKKCYFISKSIARCSIFNYELPHYAKYHAKNAKLLFSY